MRFETHDVRLYIIEQLLHAPAIDDIIDDAGEIIEFRMTGGQIVALYIIERYVDLEYLQITLKANAQAKKYSLFLMWEEMLLPAHDSWYKPDEWMVLLQAIHGGKIYGYRPNGPVYTRIFPVHLQNCPGSQVKCYIHYGKNVSFNRLQTRIIKTTNTTPGVWYIADFEGVSAYYPPPPTQSTGRQAESPPRTEISAERLALKASFQVLQVALDADRKTVRRAYREQARKAHPDLNRHPSAIARMQAINEAYRQIMNLLNRES